MGSIPTAPTKPSLLFNELQKTELQFSGLAPKRGRCYHCWKFFRGVCHRHVRRNARKLPSREHRHDCWRNARWLQQQLVDLFAHGNDCHFLRIPSRVRGDYRAGYRGLPTAAGRRPLPDSQLRCWKLHAGKLPRSNRNDTLFQEHQRSGFNPSPIRH